MCIHIHTHMYSLPFYSIYLHIPNTEDLLCARHGAEHAAHLFPCVLIITVTEVPSLQERKLGPREMECFAQSYMVSEWQSHGSELLQHSQTGPPTQPAVKFFEGLDMLTWRVLWPLPDLHHGSCSQALFKVVRGVPYLCSLFCPWYYI